ncbi:MAG TPA: hypothetical protein VNA12_06195 [Mycobacteriales bacterium]|nr:hypothetical protein [Mycobacteriales bacterium]
MTRRLLPTAALAAAALLTVDSSAAAPATLDGQKVTSHSYVGQLTGPTVYDGLLVEEPPEGAQPKPQWCKVSTCDQTALVLRLPEGRQSGRLVIELAHDPTAKMHLGVYDSKWVEVPPQDYFGMGDRLVAAQLPAGRYTVVVYDDAGQGGFRATISWKANRPHRSSSPGA